MLIGVIADDFTGASDIANTLAKGVAPEGGLATAQFPGIPYGPAAEHVEAGVISLKSRTAPIDEAVAESLAALEWLLEQGCRQIIFKYCSTFDSTTEGNIGPVGQALALAMNARGVVVCPAFPTVGRTVYQGHLFVFDTLLNESGMQNHPLTPMTDPDIRRFLALQTKWGVGHVAQAVVTDGPSSVAAALVEDAKAGNMFTVVDATSDDDLLTIGEALEEAPLITGGSGIALGLPRNFIRKRLARGGETTFEQQGGPDAILAGSCSGATRGQVDLHQSSQPAYAIDVPKVISGHITADTLVSFIIEHQGKQPLIYSSGTPEDVKEIQNRFGREKVAATLDSLFADTARKLIQRGYRKIVVAGGETSGAVAQAVADELGNPAMQIGPEIDPGVPILKLGDGDPVLLALKSGNFGAPDFFRKALLIMGGN
ncbi:3-oxo-tetronate kinase [Epibacterium ulvae]|uniref:3-oxo-tetronate kinase n=1 Tax=Epibacterium ulvae TaxID=1156985 RepID=UPI00248FB839|nr:3-oxo-tetronate kinase [Epibacterium ulvae]